MRFTCSALLILATSMALSPPSAGQEGGGWLGTERGPFSTSTLLEVWVDSEREETLTADPADKRHVTIQIWYPVSADAKGTIAPYAADLGAYDKETRETWRGAEGLQSNSLAAAPLSNTRERFPVVLYSHGSRLPSFSGTAHTEFMASHGYVVVGVGHTGWDGRVEFPDGYRYEGSLPADPEGGDADTVTYIERYRRGGQRPSQQARIDIGVRDLRFVVDRLSQLNERSGNRFRQRLDLSKIGVTGFSIGGSIALQMTLAEPRVSAAANLDGGLNGLPVLREGSKKPMLLLEASERFPKTISGTADAGMEEFFVEVERETWQMLRLSGEWVKATVKGTVHPHFSDALLIATNPPGMLKPLEAQSLINAVSLEFFNRNLKREHNTPLLKHQTKRENLNVITSFKADGP